MAYTKQNFQPGNVLKAEELNNIEDGILAVEKQVATKQPIGNYLTSESDPTVPAWAKASKKPSYTAEEVGALPATDESVAKLAVPFITPEMYGAVGDGVTDDSTAIQAAIDAAGSNTLVYLANKTYFVETGIEIKNSYAQFVCDGMLKYGGTGVAVKLVGGMQRAFVDIDMIYANDGTAIQMDGTTGSLTSCIVNVRCIRHSVIGLHLHNSGENAGSLCYNKFYIKEIVSSGTGVLVHCEALYITENWYFIGQIAGGCANGIKLINTGGNKFFSGSFEGIAADGTALHIENAVTNFFENFRCEENYGQTSVKFVGNCTGNDIELSRLYLEQVDVSELGDIGGAYNTLRSPNITTGNGKRAGHEARVNLKYGVHYLPNYAVSYLNVAVDTYTDKVIKPINTEIATSLYFNSAHDGLTYTLGDIYSGYGSMARGFPVGIAFPDGGGKIVLNDVNGDTILDNSNGKYSGRSLSVRWNGYDYYRQKNIWLIQDKYDPFATEKYVKNYAQPIGNYALKTDIPSVPVKSVNGQTGAVDLDAEDVGARPSTWTPTYSDVGADKSGTASSAVSTHNTNTSAHNDIRVLIEGLTTRLNALANSDDTTLDQMSEVVAYIKNNKSLIDGITTSKVNVADIVNNLTTNVSTKPLSAAQGVALKALIDAITVPTKVSELTNDSKFITASGVPVQSVNSKTGAVTLSASDVGARADTWMPTAANVGAVPTSRTVNGKALSANITLSASDVGALASESYTTKALAVTYEDGTSETVTLVVAK